MMMSVDPGSERRLIAYLEWALAEIRRETIAGKLTERADELIAHAEAVARRLRPTCEFAARLREATQWIKRH